jgi:kojibiose phosphorylase
MREMLSSAEWLITENGFDLARANVYETVLTVGNGYVGTRGTLEEGHLGEVSGTYLAGVYDAHDAPVIDLVNAPDWLSLAVFVDGVRLDVRNATVVEHERTLDLRSGLMYRRTVFEDAQGRRTRLETLRCASAAVPQLCALRAEITPENHDSEILVESAVDGRRRNMERLPVYPHGTTFAPEIRWEKWSRTKHLERVGRDRADDVLCLEMRTVASGITVAYAAVTSSAASSRAATGSTPSASTRYLLEDERVLQQDVHHPAGGETVRIDKLVAIATSRDPGDGTTSAGERSRALLAVHRGEGFDGIVAASRAVWDDRWADCDCVIVGDPESTQAVRFSVYHLLIAASPEDPTVNIGAKSMSGEGYRGHIFWDTEILMLPFFIFTRPQTARSLLAYRHHTLPGARFNAQRGGSAGARYAWESADTGREECPVATPDGSFRFWARDEEVHVSADVAYGIMRYVEATGDHDFLLTHGAEILFETSRFWTDRLERSPDGQRYDLLKVMGPDEFHSHVDNNAFTNHLVRWHLTMAADVHDDLRTTHPERLTELSSSLGLAASEVDHWREVAARIAVPPVRDDLLVEQFDGYFGRKDVAITDWDRNDMPRYPEGYHHFNLEDTKLLKQPDVVMLMYLLPDAFDTATKRNNFEYYEARTLHKSSLSSSIHTIMGIEVGDTSRAEQYFKRTAFVDLADNQRNTDEGMHIASAGGTWQALVSGFGGFRVAHGRMTFKPWLPEHWEEIRFGLRWHGDRLRVTIGHQQITFLLDAAAGTTLEVLVQDAPVTVTAGQTVTVPLAAATTAQARVQDRPAVSVG